MVRTAARAEHHAVGLREVLNAFAQLVESIRVGHGALRGSVNTFDLGRFDPGTPLEDIIDEISGMQSAFLAINAWPDGAKPTAKDS
jgi:hypothetical protein